jgi:hypothetical protein
MEDNRSALSTQFVSVHTLSNRFEADVLLDALKREGIPTFLRSFEETAYDGLFVCQRGWGWIMVPRELSVRALQIIQTLIQDLPTRSIYTDPSELDPMLWDRLRNADPEVTGRNARVAYDPNLAAYVVPFLGAQFLCSPDRESIEFVSGNPFITPDFQFCLALLHYLLEARPQDLSGRWIGEREIPGGELFFRGPHKLPLDPLTAIFGPKPEIFRRAAEEMNGIPVRMGDFAFQFSTLPRIPLLLVLWEGDDEFPPQLLIRFDDTVIVQLPKLDVIYALGNVFSRSIEVCAKSLDTKPVKD